MTVGVALMWTMTAARAGQNDVVSNEARAIGALRAINSGQAAYASSCSVRGYAASMDDLARPPKGSPDGYISPALAARPNDWNGYAIALVKSAAVGTLEVGTASGTCNGSATTPVSGYFASANPVSPGATGKRFFATDERGIIYFSAAPIANPIERSDSVRPIQ